MTDNPLAKLGDLTKPATVLIEKISDAVGGVFKPYQIVRVAKAEAEADRIRGESQIQVTDLHRRAMRRFFEEEAKRQSNIENITQKALPLLAEESSPQNVEDDWITNFFDKCRIVSDEDMQRLWSRVLAGEANTPGAFSKRTVNFLDGLDKKDAELFQTLCSFGWIVGKFTPLVFSEKDSVYKDRGLNFDTLTHLDSIGLIQFSSISGFQREGLPKTFTVRYCQQPLALTMEQESENVLPIGKILLSKVGEELARVSITPGVDGFVDYVKEKWKQYLPEANKTEQDGAANADKTRA